MYPRRRPAAPPWERRKAYSRHPVGRARRRWPRAYDGGGSPREGQDGGDGPPLERRQRVRSRTMDRFKHSPVRNGLIGLAIAGTAAPIAVNTYQQALRTDPAHESYAMQRTAADMADDRSVMEQWQALASEAPAADREAMIEQLLEENRDFRVSRQLAEQIHDAAVDAEIDPQVAFGLVRAESSFRNQATSPVGAVGLTQLMPRTAAWMEPGVSQSELRNPETNLRVGFKYLNYLLDKYNGDENLALIAYNRGPGTVDRILRRGGNPDNGYASFVRGEKDHGHTLYSRNR